MLVFVLLVSKVPVYSIHSFMYFIFISNVCYLREKWSVFSAFVVNILWKLLQSRYITISLFKECLNSSRRNSALLMTFWLMFSRLSVYQLRAFCTPIAFFFSARLQKSPDSNCSGRSQISLREQCARRNVKSQDWWFSCRPR